MAAACTAAEQPDEARSVYKRAIEALPDALLLTFAYADFEATQGKSAAATEAFEALLVRFPRPLCLLLRILIWSVSTAVFIQSTIV